MRVAQCKQASVLLQMKEGKENVTKENDVHRMSILYLELEMSFLLVKD